MIAASLPLKKWSAIFHLEVINAAKTMVLHDEHDPTAVVVATMMTTMTDLAKKTRNVRFILLVHIQIIDSEQVTAAEITLPLPYPPPQSLVER